MTDTDTPDVAAPDAAVEPDPEFTLADAVLVQKTALAALAMVEGVGDGRHLINVAAILTASVSHSSGTPIETTNRVHNVTAIKLRAAMDAHMPATGTPAT
jgi:hypothetical protein